MQIVSLSTATALLSLAMVLVMADEFAWMPRGVRAASTQLTKNRHYRTVFVCFLLCSMGCFSSISMVRLRPEFGIRSAQRRRRHGEAYVRPVSNAGHGCQGNVASVTPSRGGGGGGPG